MIIEVNSCKTCPCSHPAISGRTVCWAKDKGDKIADSVLIIPIWCPLRTGDIIIKMEEQPKDDKERKEETT